MAAMAYLGHCRFRPRLLCNSVASCCGTDAATGNYRDFGTCAQYRCHHHWTADDRLFFIPIIHALLIWSVILFDSHVWMATIQLLLSVFNIVFLISVLPSQRKGNPLVKMIEDNRVADEEDTLMATVTVEEDTKNCPPNLLSPRPRSSLKTGLQGTSRCQMRLMKR